MRQLPFVIAGILIVSSPAPSSPSMLQGEQDPGCLYTGELEDVRYLWGGEMRHAFTRFSQSADRHTWVVGDGGRILHSLNSQPWTVQQTPADATQTLLDVHFLPAPDELVGWAAGIGGRILKTTDGGANWSHLNPSAPTLMNSLPLCSSYGPAALWRARFLADQETGFAAGLWTFVRTEDAGLVWEDVELYTDATTTTLHPTQHFEFYALAMLEEGDDWIAVCFGQRWGGNPDCPGGHPSTGIGFMTDSRLAASDNGKKWWPIFDEQDYLPEATINDPWDFEFDPGSTLDDWTGFLSGGTGVGSGTVFRGTAAPLGANWVLELGGDAAGVSTMYGVAALGGGHAIACGYAGQIWARDANASTPTWNLVQHTGATGLYSGPLADAQTIGGTQCLVVGSWGFMRYTTNYGSSWQQANPPSADEREELWRISATHFRDELEGFAVGERRAILSTTDGGCSWTVEHGGTLLNLQGGLVAIDFAEGAHVDRGVAVGSWSNAISSPGHFTTDGGDSWSPMAMPTGSPVVQLTDVENSSGQVFWAVGTSSGNPVVLFSYDGGASWNFVPHCLPADFQVTGVSFIRHNQGIIVGHRTSGSINAYRVFYDSGGDPGCGASGPWHFEDVSPVPALNGRLHDVASRGTYLDVDAEVYAVGGPDLVLAWDIGLGRFVQVDTLLAPTGFDFLSVDLSPDGSSVLVGTQVILDEPGSSHLGKLLRFDGTSWAWIKSLTTRSVRDVFMLSDTRAWLTCRTNVEGNAEFGQVGDSTLLLYDPDGE